MGKLMIAAIAIVLMPATALGAVLYKSVAPNGTVIFSDVPPPPGARLVEQIVVTEGRATADAGLPRVVGGAGPMLVSDDAIAQANEQLDLAEHALALARRELWSPREGLRLGTRRMTRGDEERVEYYKKNVRIARRYLMELLQERRLALAAR